MRPRAEGAGERARAVEDVGADGVFTAEAAHGPFLPLVLAAHRGRRAGRVTDVPDPIGRGRSAFERMADVIDDAVRAVVLWEAAFAR